MPTRLIELSDGTLVEVAAKTDYPREISGGLAERVQTTFDQLQPVLVKVCRPIVEMCREIGSQGQVEAAEVELGFSFEGEGNIYLAKMKSGANIVLKLKIKTTPLPQSPTAE